MNQIHSINRHRRYCAFDPLPSSAEIFKFPPGVARTAAVRRLLGAGPIPQFLLSNGLQSETSFPG